jgi:hypothetical protein
VFKHLKGSKGHPARVYYLLYNTKGQREILNIISVSYTSHANKRWVKLIYRTVARVNPTRVSEAANGRNTETYSIKWSVMT